MTRRAVLALVSSLVACGVEPPDSAVPESSPTAVVTREVEAFPSRDVCGDLDESLSPASAGFRAIGSEPGPNPTLDAQRAPAAIVEAMGLRPGMRVADVGAGLGYLTFRLAGAVSPGGHVVATDVDERAIRGLCRQADGRTDVEVRRASPSAPGLEPHGYDRILLSQVDHFLPDRVAFLLSLKEALAPEGRLVVSHTRALRAPLIAAARAAGLEIEFEVDNKSDYYVVLLKPA